MCCLWFYNVKHRCALQIELEKNPLKVGHEILQSHLLHSAFAFERKKVTIQFAREEIFWMNSFIL